MLKHYFGQLRTWYADLYWKIRDEDHRDSSGKYLSIGYDDAQQFPLMEMAGPHRIVYLPDVCYLYNIYSGNDNFVYGNAFRGRVVNDNVILKPKYPMLPSLFEG